jgi:hypothetical protein
MSHDSAEKTAPPCSSDVRFDSRTLLLAAIPVALIAAIVGPYVRALQPAEQLRVGAAWIGWLALVLAWIFFVARRRIRVEKLAGRTLLRLEIYGANPRWRRIRLFMLNGALVGFGLVSLFVIAEQARATTSFVGALMVDCNVSSILLAAMVAHSVALWWWSRDIRLSSAGVVWDRRMIQWCDVQARWDPDHDALGLFGLDQHNVMLQCDVVVPDEQREAVEALVREKVGLEAARTQTVAT